MVNYKFDLYIYIRMKYNHTPEVAQNLQVKLINVFYEWHSFWMSSADYRSRRLSPSRWIWPAPASIRPSERNERDRKIYHLLKWKCSLHQTTIAIKMAKGTVTYALAERMCASLACSYVSMRHAELLCMLFYIRVGSGCPWVC